MDITPGLINKVLSLLLIIDLTHTSSFVCILFVALSPYVSMGIVACLGQLLVINNVLADWVLIIIIVENISQCLSFVDQWELGFNMDCILFVLECRSSSKADIIFDSYWLNHKIWFLYWMFMSVTMFVMTGFTHCLLSLWHLVNCQSNQLHKQTNSLPQQINQTINYSINKLKELNENISSI